MKTKLFSRTLSGLSVTVLFVDDYNDPFTLQQTNHELVEELQFLKDKVTKVHNDKKIEMKELVDTNKSLQDELTRTKNENQRFRDENFRIKRLLNETGDKEKELKSTQQELEKARKCLEQEQRLSFDWRNKGVMVEEENGRLRTEVNSLKQFNLQVEYQYYVRLIEAKRAQNSKTIEFLEELRHHPSYSSHSSLIELAMKDLDEYAARLLLAQDELSLMLETKISNARSSKYSNLDFDVKKIESPKLSSNLFLLVLDVSGPLPPPAAAAPVPAAAGKGFGQLPTFGVPPPMLPQGFAVRSQIRPQGIPGNYRLRKKLPCSSHLSEFPEFRALNIEIVQR